MLQIIEIDGKEYHADDDGIVILDEDGDPIPSHVCICHAYSDTECVCSAWDRPLPNDDDWLSMNDFFD